MATDPHDFRSHGDWREWTFFGAEPGPGDPVSPLHVACPGCRPEDLSRERWQGFLPCKWERLLPGCRFCLARPDEFVQQSSVEWARREIAIVEKTMREFFDKPEEDWSSDDDLHRLQLAKETGYRGRKLLGSMAREYKTKAAIEAALTPTKMVVSGLSPRGQSLAPWGEEDDETYSNADGLPGQAEEDAEMDYDFSWDGDV